jgi:hypothetical protein
MSVLSCSSREKNTFLGHVEWERSSGIVCSSETGAVAQRRITIWQWNACPSLRYVELLGDESRRVLLLLSAFFMSPPH